VTDSLDRLGAP
jgi:serine/threonine-protein kinase SRPK3